jgi:hypothetical protein
VFGFFVVAGNHSWYLIPMVVPMGLLCGRLIDRGLRSSPEAAGLAVGVYLTLMNSLRVGHGIRRLTQGVVSPSPPVRFALVIVVVGVLITVVYREQWLPAIRPRIAFTEWTGIIKQVFTVSLVVLVFLQLPAAGGGWGATMDQQRLGQRVHATTPPTATVYVHPSAQDPIYAFVFYAQRPLRETTVRQLHTDPDVRYALVGQSVAENLSRPHERLGSMTAWKESLVLIKVTDTDRPNQTKARKTA